MDSNDILESIAGRIIEVATHGSIKIAGIPIVIAGLSKQKMAELYRQALYDYSIEKLLDTEENKVIVEDIRFIFSRLNEQFTSADEKEIFYSNYVHSILSAYNDLTGKKLGWHEVSEEEVGDFPKIGGAFVTKPSTTSEEAALWIYREYEKELASSKENVKEKPKQHQKSRWNKFRK